MTAVTTRARSTVRAAVAAALVVAGAMTATPAQALAPAAVPAALATTDGGAILLVIDASGSMQDNDNAGQPKIVTAKRALVTLAGELPDGAPVGLRVFGRNAALSANPTTCTDSQLSLPVAALDRSAMTKAIGTIDARGWTPMGFALTQARADMSAYAGRRSSIVLVSDGVDECAPKYGPEPCDVAREIAAARLDLRVQTIGVTVDAKARKQLQCIARVTGGRYWDAEDANSLADALRASLAPAATFPDGPPEPPPADSFSTLAFLALAVGLFLTARNLVVMRRRNKARAYW